MCGIAGFAAGVAGAPANSDIAVSSMLTAMSHRGPDDEGIDRDSQGRCVLAHARLSIIDITKGGHQPMRSADGRFAMAFNGEIYNYRELRQELEACGRMFRTNSDTEVLLEGFAMWGDACISRLRGMFAFAIWDEHEATLTLVRDRLGIKPLYFCTARGALWFASEVRTLLASNHVPRAVNRPAVRDYLEYGSFQQPATVIEGVESLPPGHLARVRNGKAEIHAFWGLAGFANQCDAASHDYVSAASRLREMLEEATRLHMIADVPVGAFLSGGIDSRLVVGLMSHVATSPIRTFTVAFEQGPGVADERALAARTASDFGCEHTEVVIGPQDFARDIEAFLEAVDCPSIDGFNTYLVSRAARQAVKVVLSGLGGDELFAGYPHFGRIERASRLLPGGNIGLAAVAQSMRGLLPGRILMPLLEAGHDLRGRLRLLRRLTLQRGVGSIVGPALNDATGKTVAGATARGFQPIAPDVINAVSEYELTHYLPNTLLRDGDVMSMRHGLELRPLLLDHVITEYAVGLPGNFKYRDLRAKSILITACRDLLPDYVTSSPKLGFETPIRSWVTRHAGERVMATLAQGGQIGLLSPVYVQAAMRRVARAAPLRLHEWASFLLSDYVTRHGLEVAA
jgi:asparagine synthase (glutamine-hydrolysing)